METIEAITAGQTENATAIERGRNTVHATLTTARLDALAKPTRVILRLWGCTDADVERAEANARHWDFSSTWDIVEVIPSTGTPCPIPRDDPIALKQGALYDAAWAAYQFGQAPP